MNIEISEENMGKIEEINNLKFYRQHDITYLVNRSVEKYYERVMDKVQLDVFRKSMIRKRLSFQGWDCYWCGRALTVENSTVDHLVPLIRGGKSSGSNLVICCENCNGEKGDMTGEEYEQLIKLKLSLNKKYEQGTEDVRANS
jgi:5-methylcytosine-specific restriction protein A